MTLVRPVRIAAVLLTLGTVAVGTPASAATQGTAPVRPAHHQQGPAAISARSADLYPENTAWDPTRGVFLVGSARYGTISTVDLNGNVKELAPAFGTVSTLGIKVDRPRGRFVVAYTDYWIRQATNLDQPPTSGVAIYDLASGRLLQRIPLYTDGGGSFADDLAVDDDGAVYVTNPVSATIVRIDPDGTVSPFLTDPRFASNTVGPNGIVWRDGYLIIGLYDKGELYQIPTGVRHPRARQIKLPLKLIGADGIALRPNGDLIVTTNSNGRSAGVQGGVDAVTVLRSHDGWRSAKVVKRVDPWQYAGPTGAAVTPYGAYVLTGHLDRLGQETTPSFDLNLL
ncbi:hypothetical protein [Kitasatospora sp. SUK 42]|uniref:hypothetical protein n=1 Tax=Kitasatospora sp. SUK 42 TaxID=1588882 RepID=UPI0018C93805|nr:hypothetical protein [Kitasatospora sp. SUK 42]MBV2154811.1 hypothetical protein [Kitasatospora sp. SUK 42]